MLITQEVVFKFFYLFIFYFFIYLFAQKTTVITVTKVAGVHELDKKANKLTLTIILPINIIDRYIHNT